MVVVQFLMYWVDRQNVGVVHVLHTVAPATPENVEPAVHEAQADAREAPVVEEKVPMGQELHWVDELAPDTVEKVPAAQAEHVADETAPTADEKVPAAQAEQVADETR